MHISVYFYIIAMAITTYLIRAIPLVLFQRKIHNKFFNSFLYYVPYTCLTAMTVPSVFYITSSVYSAIVGFAVALILGYKEKSLIVVALSSCFAVFIVELLMNFI